MTVLGAAAVASAGVAALAWITVSFSRPGRRRAVVEWIGPLGLSGALLAFFSNLARSAWLEDSTVALVGFGFLAVVFGAGGLLSLHRLVQVIRRRGPGESSATN